MAFRFQSPTSKTAWKEPKNAGRRFLCALCKIPRAVSLRTEPGTFKHYVQVGITAVFFTMVTWSWFEWKGIISFVPFWLVFETVYRTRVRAALACPHCGFDPYLFKWDELRAKKEIETHWRKKYAEKGVPWPTEGPSA
jgi:hypothetical protein